MVSAACTAALHAQVANLLHHMLSLGSGGHYLGGSFLGSDALNIGVVKFTADIFCQPG